MSFDPSQILLARGGLVARYAADPMDMARRRSLRDQAFPALAGQADAFDARCRHLLVEGRDGRLLLCLRLMVLRGGADPAQSYSAEFYDLRPLLALPGAALEIGRLCLAPAAPEAWEALRLAWAALSRIAGGEGVTRLFGCASFTGGEPERHRAALAVLAGGRQLVLPHHPAAERVEFAAAGPGVTPDPAALPPLLRFYLSLGARISDHAVRDRQLDTLHVLTWLETAELPMARGKSLRAMGSD